ncbi:hypothetical protein SYK_26460 [Pseudodesulfovibrio nedwellii]|uniref:Uncharacterized protein n=1 Tax=Pseudodesulfovibrio nedwellii TaxID=2973072 RepID=A0ABM8B3A8_9BACT|nr:hypothetical protein SYK_26460 [Pseudodesulfovibrio nedwellii]
MVCGRRIGFCLVAGPNLSFLRPSREWTIIPDYMAETEGNDLMPSEDEYSPFTEDSILSFD